MMAFQAGLSAQADELSLRNGLIVSVSAVAPDDEPALLEFLRHLRPDSQRLRFFTTGADLRAEAHRGSAGDDADHHGVIATAVGQGIVGHAIYVRVPRSERAEVAVEVNDDLHNQGLATLLLIRLARFAEARGITRMFAEVLPENRDMLAVFRDGFAAPGRAGRDEISIEYPTAAWRSAKARFER